VKKQARYRWNWNKRSNRGLDDDYSSLFALVNALNTPGTDAYTAAVESVVDVEQWMRVFAARRIVADWDGYGYNRGKNTWAYKPTQDRWQMILWDLDFSLGGGSDGPTTGLFGANDPTITRMYNHPPFRRIYLRAFHEALQVALPPETMYPVMDHQYQAFLANQLNVGDPAPSGAGSTSVAPISSANSMRGRQSRHHDAAR
jgi:spore coat protein CotH